MWEILADEQQAAVSKPKPILRMDAIANRRGMMPPSQLAELAQRNAEWPGIEHLMLGAVEISLDESLADGQAKMIDGVAALRTRGLQRLPKIAAGIGRQNQAGKAGTIWYLCCELVLKLAR